MEYLAEKRSAGFVDFDDDNIKKIINIILECTMSSSASNFDGCNLSYLIKQLPYFIARTNDDNIKDKYMSV